mgnify:CR=1 FL=1
MRLGFVGGWGHHYLRGLMDDAEAVAFAGDGRDDAAARQRCDDAADARWFDDVTQLLDAFRPDVVNVGCVYAHNAPVIAACLQRGIPVVSDKPIAATWAQLDELRALCDGHLSRRIITEMDWRCHASLRAARGAVASGKGGEEVRMSAKPPYGFGTRAEWNGNRADFGGMIPWVASHALDAVMFATSKPVVRTFGTRGNLAHRAFDEMEDHTISVVELANGARGVVHADFLRPAAAATHGDDRLRIAGSEGVIEIRDGRCRLTTNRAAERDITEQAPSLKPARALYDAAVHGEETTFSTAHSLELAAVLLAARDAADEMRMIDVPRPHRSAS